MDMGKFREMFLSEAKDHLHRMNELLPQLERDPGDRDAIDNLFREVHSVKGMAASMGYERTTALTHRLEDTMSACRKKGEMPQEVFAPLQAGFDLLAGLLEDLEAEREERGIDLSVAAAIPAIAFAVATTPAAPASIAAAGDLQLTVHFAADAVLPAARALLILRELADLGTVVSSQPTEEELVQGGGGAELNICLRSERASGEIQEILQGMSDVERVVIAEGANREAPTFQQRRDDKVRSVRIGTDLLDRFVALTGELITNRYILQASLREERWSDLHSGLEQQVRLINTLHHYVLRSRMIPLENITGRLPRLVREVCRATGKEVTLRLEGADIELDRALIEGLADPLMHLVRNAIDHGIDGQGEVAVRAWREQDKVLLEVADNGRGIDPAAIGRKAVERGLLAAAQLQAMPPAELLKLICLPGFSTAAQVTEISGRGVGMDVVKSAMDQLGGTLSIDSAPGCGTRFLLKLPLSVTIINLLLVECAGHLLGIPFTRLLRTEEISRSEIRVEGRQTLANIGGEDVPILSLRKILALPAQPPGPSVSVVLTEARSRRIALVVDRIAGQRQAFVKSLGYPLDQLPGVCGATVLGDGSVIFILDPQTLLEGLRSRPAGRKERSHDVQPVDGRAA